MRVKNLLLALSAVGIAADAAASPQQMHMICLVENAAGITASRANGPSTGHAIEFAEGHKKFVLTVGAIEGGQRDAQFCMQTLNYWNYFLRNGLNYPDETLGPGPKVNGSKTIHDYRYNIGPNCFASREAKIKFFDRDSYRRMVSYDFLPNEFTALPGEWLKLYGRRFEMGDDLDAGPVVLTGTCEDIPN